MYQKAVTMFYIRTTNLNGCWSQCKQFISGTFGVSIHIDKNVDSICVDTICGLPIARQLGKVNEVFRFSGDFTTKVCLIIRTQGITENLKYKQRGENADRLHLFLSIDHDFQVPNIYD